MSPWRGGLYLIREDAIFLHPLQEVSYIKSVTILKVDLQQSVVHSNRKRTWRQGEGREGREGERGEGEGGEGREGREGRGEGGERGGRGGE